MSKDKIKEYAGGVAIPEGYDAEQWYRFYQTVYFARKAGVVPYFITDPFTLLNDQLTWYPELETYEAFNQRMNQLEKQYGVTIDYLRGLLSEEGN